MKNPDMRRSVLARIIPVLITENKKKQRLWTAVIAASLVLSAVFIVMLVRPGLTAEPDYYVSMLSDAEYGRAYQVRFSYTYDGREGESVFLRFRPIGKYANSVTVNGQEVFGVQHLLYASDMGIGEMQRLSFGSGDDYYYYPYHIMEGDTVAFAYTLYLLGEINADNLNSVDFEVIQTRNSASVIMWNVIIENGAVSPFDGSLLAAIEYYDFDVPYMPLPEPEADNAETSETQNKAAVDSGKDGLEADDSEDIDELDELDDLDDLDELGSDDDGTDSESEDGGDDETSGHEDNDTAQGDDADTMPDSGEAEDDTDVNVHEGTSQEDNEDEPEGQGVDQGVDTDGSGPEELEISDFDDTYEASMEE